MLGVALTQLVEAAADDDSHGNQLAAAEDVLNLGSQLHRPAKKNYIFESDVYRVTCC